MRRARSSMLAALFTRLASGITLGSGVTIVPRDVLFSGVVFSAGDIIAQRLSKRPRGAQDDQALVPVDGLRAISACALGVLYGGGFLPVVYQLAEKWAPGRGAQAVLIKAAAVTAVCSTAGNYASMMWRRCSAPSEVPGESLRARAPRDARARSTVTFLRSSSPTGASGRFTTRSTLASSRQGSARSARPSSPPFGTPTSP